MPRPSGDEVGDVEPVVVLEARVVSGEGGGPDKTILNTPRFLRSTRYRTLCAYMYPPDDPGFDAIRARAEDREAPLVGVPDRGAIDPRAFRELLAICRRERVNIWHGHDYKSNLLGLLLAPFHPMVLITTAHGWVLHTKKTPIYYGIDRLCLKRYDHVICVSGDLFDACTRLGIPPSRRSLVENGIHLEDYRPRRGRGEAKGRLGIDAGRIVLGAVGRLSPEKGFAELIRATARLIHEGHDLALLIGGDGDQRPALEALVADCGAAGRIRLLGFLDDPRDLYEATDLYVLSSRREGLPNVLLEAMAMGVPCLATRVGGVPNLIEHRHNGLLIDHGPGLEENLMNAIRDALRQTRDLNRMGDRGRQAVAETYSFARRMDKIVRIYDEALARCRRHRT